MHVLSQVIVSFVKQHIHIQILTKIIIVIIVDPKHHVNEAEAGTITEDGEAKR